jgi:predicted N-acetyltransferase YhbS
MSNDERLNPPLPITKNHDCSSFDCEIEELNFFLKRLAFNNQKKNSSRTYVATRENRVVGYYTLAFSSISPDDATEKVMKGLGNYPVPAILLARLAVHKDEQGKGIGKGLLKDAVLKTVNASQIAGLRAMLIHAKDDKAKVYYEQFGFEESRTNKYHLMLTITDLQNNLG